MSKADRDIVDFTPPPLALVEKMLRPQELYFNPSFYGMDNVHTDQPALYVANHTIYGMLDSPLLFLALYREKGIVLRSLGDEFHYKVPGWRDMVSGGGAVLGTRENCSRLMDAGEHILVFPGGGREVAKRKGEANKLIWKTRTGFARMAIEKGYPIIPVAALGADDAFDIVYDALDLKQSRVGRWLMKNKAINKQLRDGDVFMPIARGIGPLPFPRPEKFYFSFSAPISTEAYQGQANDLEAQWAVRAQVMAAIEQEMDNLKLIRQNDPDVGVLRRMLTKHHG